MIHAIYQIHSIILRIKMIIYTEQREVNVLNILLLIDIKQHQILTKKDITNTFMIKMLVLKYQVIKEQTTKVY
jgi:hypothetical protein